MSTNPISLPATLMPRTFPLWEVDGHGACTCHLKAACEDAGKHPGVSWREFDNRGTWPDYGDQAGMRTGDALFVIDCDSTAAILAFVRDYPEAEHTFMVWTAKGAHFYFRADGVRTKTCKDAKAFGGDGCGIDVRGDGGYVVIPGSMHRTGVRYEVGHDAPIATASAGLALAVLDDGPRRVRSEPEEPIPAQHPNCRRMVDAFTKRCQSHHATDGSVNLLTLCQWGVREFRLPREVVKAIIVRDYNPRCRHRDGRAWPWSEEEIDHKIDDAIEFGSFSWGDFGNGADLFQAAMRRIGRRNAVRSRLASIRKGRRS